MGARGKIVGGNRKRVHESPKHRERAKYLRSLDSVKFAYENAKRHKEAKESEMAMYADQIEEFESKVEALTAEIGD